MDLRTLELRIARSENLPVLPQVVSAVLKLADDPDASPREMERTVERDPAISAKILRVANSPYIGATNVNSIGRAVSVLGVNNVRSLAVGVAYQNIISGKQMSLKFEKLQFWRHSLATATAARILAKLKMAHRAEELYTAAMMHDVGLLVMEKFCPNELDAAITMAQTEQMPLYKAETMILGFNHTKIGVLLADRWGLSPVARAAIQYHHDPYADPDDSETTLFISAANAFAIQCGYINQAPPETIPFDPDLMDAVGLPEQQYAAIMTVLHAEITKAESAFHIN